MKGVFYIVTKDGKVIFKPEFMMTTMNEESVQEVSKATNISHEIVYKEINPKLYIKDYSSSDESLRSWYKVVVNNKYFRIMAQKNMDDWDTLYKKSNTLSTKPAHSWWNKFYDEVSEEFFKEFLDNYIINDLDPEDGPEFYDQNLGNKIFAYLINDSEVDYIEGGSLVNYISNSEIGSITGDARVYFMNNVGVSNIDSKVNIGVVSGSSTIVFMHDHSKIGTIGEYTSIKGMAGHAHIGSVVDRATIGSMDGNSSIEDVGDHSVIDNMDGNSSIGYLGGFGVVNSLDGNSFIKSMDENSYVETVKLSNAYIGRAGGDADVGNYHGSKVPVGSGVESEALIEARSKEKTRLKKEINAINVDLRNDFCVSQ